jgi:hypothetical protein
MGTESRNNCLPYSALNGILQDWGLNVLKVALSFICGAVICYLIIIGIKPVLPAMADETGNGAISGNSTGLANLLPNFEKIYRDALSEPFIKAESKITDPDIADYYHGLMNKTGLTNSDSN